MSRFGALPGTADSTIAEKMSDDELRQTASELWLADTDIFQPWVEGSVETFFDIPEMRGLPGKYAGPVMLLPARDGVLAGEALEDARHRYPEATVVDLPTGHDLGLSDGDVAPLLEALRGFIGDVIARRRP